MSKRYVAARVFVAIAGIVVATAVPVRAEPAATRPTIVVTYSILGSVVRDLAGDRFDVVVAIPNGMDPHEWEPSARDVERLTRADLVVANGLDLEGGMQKALEQARHRGVKFFTAADHITVRRVGRDEGIPSGDPDQAIGAPDPHLWMDPIAMKSVVRTLAIEIRNDFGVDLSARAADLEGRLDSLDAEIRAKVAVIPLARRELVTGHESMGYFAQRYRFRLVGAVVPSLSSQAESSAADLADLKAVIARERVPVLFTELGTPPGVVAALAREAGVRCVTLTDHALPANGSYFTFMRDLTDTIAGALR